MTDHKKIYKILVDGGEELYIKVKDILDKSIINDEPRESTIYRLSNLMSKQQATDLYEAEFEGTAFFNSKK